MHLSLNDYGRVSLPSIVPFRRVRLYGLYENERVLIIIRYVGGSTAVRAFLCNTNNFRGALAGDSITDSKRG